MKKEEFFDKLTEVKLSEETFSKITNTPIPTIRGWFTKRKNRIVHIPKWVVPFLEIYAENEHRKSVIKYLEEKEDAKQ